MSWNDAPEAVILGGLAFEALYIATVLLKAFLA